MVTIDKWAANKLDAVKNVVGDGYKIKIGSRYIDLTIKDLRCREIFRNWWLQGSPTDKPRSVRFDTDKVYYGEWDEIGCKMLFSGDDEEDCITAIYEAERLAEES